MTKQEVIAIFLSKTSDPSKFSQLVAALGQAPVKNLASVSFYNRSGYSKRRFSSLVYDVKKSFQITESDLKMQPKPTVIPIETKANKRIELNVDFTTLDYHKELKPLAIKVAETTAEELKSLKKADLIAFLEEKKSKIQPQDEEQ